MAMGAPVPAQRAPNAAPIPHQAPLVPVPQAQQVAPPPQAHPPPLGYAIIAPPGQVQGGGPPAEGAPVP